MSLICDLDQACGGKDDRKGYFGVHTMKEAVSCSCKHRLLVGGRRKNN